MTIRTRSLWTRSGELITSNDTIVVIPIWRTDGVQEILCEARVKAMLADGSEMKSWDLLQTYKGIAGALAVKGSPAANLSALEPKDWTATLAISGSDVTIELKGPVALDANWWWDTETRVMLIG